MIIPTTHATAVAMAILAMICWGLWANTFKLGKGWRFELYYFDFAIGVLLTAVVAMLTFGSMGEELTVSDNLLIAGKRQIAWAALAGVIFNVGHMLLLAATSVSGLAVAFPMGLSLALIVGVLWSLVLSSHQSIGMLLGGAGLLLLSLILGGLAYWFYTGTEDDTFEFSLKGVVLALAGGLMIGCSYPLIDLSRIPEVGLGAYTLALFFSIGLFFSTFILNLYFMNLPVEGEPVGLGRYFKGSMRVHLLGVLGGLLWMVGFLGSLAAAASPVAAVDVGHWKLLALAHAAALVAMLCGLFVWREYRESEGRVKVLLALLFVTMAAGLAMIGTVSVA